MEDTGPTIAITVSEPSEAGNKKQVLRTQSDSSTESPASRDHDTVKGRSRSVNFFSGVEDNSEKRRLQRTPTPYWSRKELGDDTSADEDGIDYTPNYDPPDWGDVSGSSGDHLFVETSCSQRSLGVATGPNRESPIKPGPSSVSPAARTNVTADDILGAELSPKQTARKDHQLPELYLNPLFRKVAGLPDQ